MIRRLVGERKFSALWGRAAKNFGILGIAAACTMLFGLGQTVLLTKSLSIDDFGIYVFVIGFYTFIAAILKPKEREVLLRFYDQNKKSGDQAGQWCLLTLVIGVLAGTGLIFTAGAVFVVEVFGDSWFDREGSKQAILVYAIALPFSFFTDFFMTLLRLEDRFAAVAIPDVISRGITVLGMAAYVLYAKSVNLNWIVGIAAGGTILMNVLMFVSSLTILRSNLQFTDRVNASLIREAYGRTRRSLWGVMMHSNISSLLRASADNGIVLLLGILGTSVQVAYFGFATQVCKPLKTVSRMLASLLGPEISRLYASGDHTQMCKLVRTYARTTGWIGLILVPICIAAAWYAVPLVAKPEYRAALPAIALLLITYVIAAGSYPLYITAVLTDQLPRRNKALLVRMVILLGVACIHLDATTAAGVSCLGILAVLLSSDLPTFRGFLKKTAESHSMESCPPDRPTPAPSAT